MVICRYCSCGFPHSEICGSKGACPSPQLFAACHVLHRLEVPRHPPCALSSLTVKLTREQRLFESWIWTSRFQLGITNRSLISSSTTHVLTRESFSTLAQ